MSPALLLLFVLGQAVPAPAPGGEAVPAVADVAAGPGLVEGRIRMADVEEPVVGASVRLLGPGGAVHVAGSDARGSWRLGALAAGEYRLEVTAEGFVPARGVLRVEAGRRKVLEVRLAPELGEALSVTAPQGGVARKLRESTDAVEVVELERARERAADLGEVLRRVEGVTLQRTGALGAPSTLALNGLSGTQVRVFLDGVPLELAGWGEDVGSVPVPLLERVEVYKGVVPLRLGADALGGAVHLVSNEQTWRSFAQATLSGGSFGTGRLTLAARAAPRGPLGLFGSARLALDRADNDYLVDVEAPDAQGRLSALRVPRFHDAYRALSAGVEGGLAGRSWADVLALRVSHARSSKELQHNPVMSIPYGEARSGARSWALQGRYRKEALGPVDVEGLVHASWRRLSLRDASPWVYDWRGERVRERRVAGELGEPRDAFVLERGLFGRLGAGLALAPGHQLRATVSPQVSRRVGDDRLDEVAGARDVLNEPQVRASLVSGLGWDARWGEGRVENSLFLKHYWLAVRAEQQVQFGQTEAVRRAYRTAGVGDGVRVRLSEAWALKASYEWATRLPSADESFGDGVLVAPNPGLRPERSHNVNVGAQWDAPAGAWGTAGAQVTAFARSVSDQVVLMTGELAAQHQNVLAARGLGLEASGRWASPGGRLEAQAGATWTDLRNTSRDGTFAPYRGDRIPNRPYLSAAAELRASLDGPLPSADTLRPFWASRYTHRFFRTWESLGARDTKQAVPAQLVHDAGVTWALPQGLGMTLEVRNLLDARTYDVVGVQGPGRAFSLSLTGTLDLSSPTVKDSP